MTTRYWICMLALMAAPLACGGSDDEASFGADSPGNNATVNNSANEGYNNVNNGWGDDGNNATNNVVIPEKEEFLVRQVATTENYVFVPNGADGASTVARIDGRDLSVHPLRVGINPTDVVATEVEDVGPVSYVLCEGSSAVAIIRADKLARDGKTIGDVKLLSVPQETNALKLAPDGVHAIAYIDPERPVAGTSVSSLQTLSVIRLDPEGNDQAFNLSVSRLIRDIEFTDSGDMFIVGREGVNRVRLQNLQGDTLIPPLDLGLTNDIFPAKDLEIEVARDGSFMVVRSLDFAGVAIYELPPASGGVGTKRVIDLSGRPTDIDLLVEGDTRRVIATVRETSEIVLFDVDEALSTPEDQEVPLTSIQVLSKEAGLAQVTPDGARILLYSTLPLLPSLGWLDVASNALVSRQLRNQIRSVALSPDSKTAVVVHTRQEDIIPQTPDEIFRANHGITLVGLDDAFVRPVILQAEPLDIVMTPPIDNESFVYVMLGSSDAARRGLMRIDLQTLRSDFVALPKQPNQIGMVAGKIFVGQEADDGRITFFDIKTQTQRTVSGYELNAEID